ncbi:MAG: Amuc_1100 family pilus-like protein [Chthoniobacterales bacterium]
MNWVQKNPFFTAFLGGTFVAGAAAAYFSLSAFTKFEEVSAQYNDAVSRLHGLQNKIPFPSEENLKAFAVLTDAYEAKFDELLGVIATRQTPLETVSPQVFQDNLRAVVSSVSELAKQNGVELPEGFYLGFDQYRGTLPSDAAAPLLAAQLAGVQSIISDLIKLKVHAITSIARVPLAIESGAPQPRNEKEEKANEEKTAEPIIVSSPLDIGFRAEQGKVRQALNGIVTANRVFIIRSLTIQNTQLEGPSRQQDVAATATQPDAGANVFAELLGNQSETGAGAKTSLSVIVGRELVEVNTRIEMIGFNLPEKKE